MFAAPNVMIVPDDTVLLLAQFALGYMLIAAVPGPNMIVLGGLAALRGWRGALPLCAGIAVGAGAMVAAMHATMGHAAPWLAEDGDLVAGTLLLAIGGRMLFAPRQDNAGGESSNRAALLWFVAGFATSATNPVTAAFFAAQLLGPLWQSPAGSVLLFLVPVQALGWAMFVAAAFAQPRLRGLVLRRRRSMRMIAGVVLAGMGVAALAWN